MHKPPIAVIILNWNGEKLLQEFLPQVIANTNPMLAKVIVADNGSSDQSVNLLKKEFPEVELLKFDKNYGFAEGYNKALEITNYPFSVLFNSDAAPAPGWIEPLLNFMHTHKDVAACQPKLLSYTEPHKFEYAGACGGFLDKHGYPYCRGRIFEVCEEDQGQYDSELEVFWASGAALMVNTQIYLEAGGLDPKFFAHMEEIDLCWRMKLMGYKIAVMPQSVVYHLGGGSLPASSPRKTYLNFRNNLLMMHKNLPDSSRSRKLLIRRLLDTAAFAKYLLSGDIKNAVAIWNAHRDFSKMRKDYLSHPSTDLLTSPTNILIDHYLKHISHFSSL